MKRILLIFSLVCGLVMFLNSCQKSDPGPIGATGPAGPAGPAGATGASGAAGATGTANVIYSPWANLTFTGSGTSWSAALAAPGVTQAILDKGAVKTYFQFGTQVYEGNYNNANTNHSIYQNLTLGAVNLVATFNATYPWRYVIIPGGVAGNRSSNNTADSFVFADGTTMRKTDFDKMSYEDVCSKFNIPKY